MLFRSVRLMIWRIENAPAGEGKSGTHSALRWSQGRSVSPRKKRSCAAIDFRPFRFLADKAAVAADFHLGNGACYYEEQRIASTAGVCTLCDFRLGKQDTEVPTLHTCHYVKNILGKQCTCGHTSCFMQISALLPFAKTCWETSQTL